MEHAAFVEEMFGFAQANLLNTAAVPFTQPDLYQHNCGVLAREPTRGRSPNIRFLDLWRCPKFAVLVFWSFESLGFWIFGREEQCKQSPTVCF